MHHRSRKVLARDHAEYLHYCHPRDYLRGSLHMYNHFPIALATHVVIPKGQEADQPNSRLDRV